MRYRTFESTCREKSATEAVFTPASGLRAGIAFRHSFQAGIAALDTHTCSPRCFLTRSGPLDQLASGQELACRSRTEPSALPLSSQTTFKGLSTRSGHPATSTGRTQPFSRRRRCDSARMADTPRVSARRRPEPGVPYFNLLMANKAAVERFGSMRPHLQEKDIVDQWPEEQKTVFAYSMSKEHEECVVSPAVIGSCSSSLLLLAPGCAVCVHYNAQ